MSFFSSVFARFTEPGINDRQGAEPRHLACNDEVDDFMLVSKVEDQSNQQMQCKQMAPPMYNEVMSVDRGFAHRQQPVSMTTEVNPYHPDLGGLHAQTFENGTIKMSALDGVPFTLWCGDVMNSKCLGDEASAILFQTQQANNPDYFHSRYKYSFDRELSILKEYGVQIEVRDSSDLNMNSTEEKSSIDYSYPQENLVSDFGFEEQLVQTGNTGRTPDVGCLIEI